MCCNICCSCMREVASSTILCIARICHRIEDLALWIRVGPLARLALQLEEDDGLLALTQQGERDGR